MSSPADKQINAEAAGWLIRLEDTDHPVSARRQAEFFDWLKRSPQHVQAFFETADLWRGLEGFDAAQRVDLEKLLSGRPGLVSVLARGAAAREGTGDVTNGLAAAGRYRPHGQRASRRLMFGWSLAAAATITCAVVAWSLLGGPSQTYRTAVGEQRILKLADGSVVQLNTRSRVTVDYSADQRRIALLEGEALFTVARDPVRPFLVRASSATIQAVGTQFNVQDLGTDTRVTVVEGAVQVSRAHAKPERLEAGEEIRVTASASSRHRVPDVASAVAWRERRLVFENAPLAGVAAEFNRYNSVPIRTEGTVGQTKHITGIFSADHPQSLVMFLEREAGLGVEERAGEIVVRAR